MKHFFVNNTSGILYLISFLLIGIISYRIGLNQQTSNLASNISIVYPNESAIINEEKESSEKPPANEPTIPSKSIIASKSGKVYYTAGCSGSNRIKDENKVYFQTEEEAQSLGLTLSKTCQ